MTFTIKEWQENFHAALGGMNGNDFQQHDLNPDFWDYLLDNDQSCIFDRVVDFHHHESSYNLHLVQKVIQVLAQKSIRNCSIDLTGCHFNEESKASLTALAAFVRNNSNRQLFHDFFKKLNKKYMLLSGYSIISLGIDSLDGLVFAALFADYIHRYDKGIHVCLGRHQYENFSLIGNLVDSVATASLLQLFDSVILYKERADEALVGLLHFLQGGKQHHLNNISIRVEGDPQLFLPEADKGPVKTSFSKILPQEKMYLQKSFLPVDRIVYLLPLVGNSCYHGKCSFCVQNQKNIKPVFYSAKNKIEHTLERISFLSKEVGVCYFSFSDQAVGAGLLRQFSEKIIARKIKINWCVRMIFDTGLEPDFVNLLKRAGCNEVLFGLESCNPSTLLKMNKADTEFSESTALTLLQNFNDVGIDVCLNFIYFFPSESDAQFIETTWSFFLKCLKRFNNISYILNKFTLFQGTAIAKNPLQYGVQHLFPQNTDLPRPLNYVDRWGRQGNEGYGQAKFMYASLGRDIGALSPEELLLPPQLRGAISHLHHSTIGIVHRLKTKKFLADSLCAAFLGPVEKDAAVTFSSTLVWKKQSKHKRDYLLIGCNSYLGQNLASSMDERQLVLSSRNLPNEICQKIDTPFVQEDLTRSINQLAAVKARHIFLLSRPLEQDFTTNNMFTYNLKKLLMEYVNNGVTREITFISTQLVYATPEKDTPLATCTETKPEAIYEYFKQEIEIFLAFLARKFDIKVRVCRIPLLIGGLILPSQKNNQLIYSWVNAYRNGYQWNFKNDEERSFGNSWLWMKDFISFLQTEKGEDHYRICHPSSGDFTYFELGEIFKGFIDPGMAEVSNGSLPLVRSHFFLRNEVGFPEGDFHQVLKTVVQIGNSLGKGNSGGHSKTK